MAGAALVVDGYLELAACTAEEVLSAGLRVLRLVSPIDDKSREISRRL